MASILFRVARPSRSDRRKTVAAAVASNPTLSAPESHLIEQSSPQSLDFNGVGGSKIVGTASACTGWRPSGIEVIGNWYAGGNGAPCGPRSVRQKVATAEAQEPPRNRSLGVFHVEQYHVAKS